MNLKKSKDSEKLTDIISAIFRERKFQKDKWGTNTRTVGEYLLIMEKELSEAKEGFATTKGNNKALEEILQVIAVGVACLEEHGVVERPELVPDRQEH